MLEDHITVLKIFDVILNLVEANNHIYNNDLEMSNWNDALAIGSSKYCKRCYGEQHIDIWIQLMYITSGCIDMAWCEIV